MIELLSPVGNLDCLKSAVQNGADSVYFGSNLFSARAFATNFNLEELQKAIQYAKIRGVRTNLTLNTLIKDDEFSDAFNLAKKAYEFGIDAIIVQDLGLAKKIIKEIPKLPIHGSTQMTIHNLNGALQLQELGFKRVVLSRELSIDEIEYIRKNTKLEIEVFIHGALCISYSGQCLFSSMLGGRSGNRGKCAQPCRLPYELLENNKKIDVGHLLSTRDLCGLDYIPSLINLGVNCLKIEGRMKSPEYVATVTKIYRKYIDLALSKEEYIIDEKDKKQLLQVFNRGLFSCGHLNKKENKELVYKEKPNNMGLFLGIVEKYNKNKGLITLKLKEKIETGDTISLQNETGTYTISELMEDNKNIITTEIGQTVIIGRMKGNIKLGDKIYKMSSKSLISEAQESYKHENKKIPLTCKISIKKEQPISITIKSNCNLDLYKNLNIECKLNYIPLEAKNKPLYKETIIKQISKTSSTPYKFKNIEIDLDDNVFIPKLSILNELRRTALENVQNYIINNISRTLETKNNKTSTGHYILDNMKNYTEDNTNNNVKISLLINLLNLNYDYSKLENIDNLYIPLKYFLNNKYEDILKVLTKKFKTYIYLPTIIKVNYRNLFYSNIHKSIDKYKIEGFVISNLGNIQLLTDLFENLNKHFKIIANYTLNTFNINTVLELKHLGVSKFTISPELDRNTIYNLCKYNYIEKELIVYGKIPLLHMNYCLLGNTDNCYPECKQNCKTSNTYFLRDRLNMNFRVLPDNIQTVTTIYNSKTTSICPKDFSINYARIDILDETIDEITQIISTVKAGNRFEGREFTNGNLNRDI